MSWLEDNEWEGKWWSDCKNTLREELLQFSYAKRMKLEVYADDKTPYNINCNGNSVIDFGGGPVSMLLKCKNVGSLTVVDPCIFPTWIAERYACAKISYLQIKAEDYDGGYNKQYDEAWIYNVLQHTVSPEKVIQVAKQTARRLRIFEFIDAGISPGHPHELTEDKLNLWISGVGTVEQINENQAVGKCYYGVFDVD